MDGQEIRQRFETLWSYRKTVEQSWDFVSRFVMPLRSGDFYREYVSEHSVEFDRHRREVFDSTAILAAQNLAASLHGGLTTPLVRWFDIRFREDELNNNGEAKAWLEDCADRCWMALQESNFNLEANSSYLDLVSFGTAPIVEEAEEDENGNFKELVFRSVPIREAFFEADHKDQILRFYRHLEWKPAQVIEKFGKNGVPEHIVAKAETPTGATENVRLVFCIFDRPQYRNADVSGVLPPTRRPWGKKYILRNDGTELGEEGGYYEMPAFLPRWRKTSGSQWGHSPAMVCMGDILTLNDLVSMQLDALEKAVDPPMLVTERGLLSDRDLTPGGLTVLRNLDDIRPYESATRVDWVNLEFQRLQQSIRQSFFVDQLELKESPAMTATEVTVRYELMNRLLGPTFGRLQSDFLDPLVQRTFWILFRAGQLQQMPEIVANAQSELDIEYVGPMSRAQKQDKTASLERWTSFVATLASSHPAFEEMADVIDTDALPRQAADLMGVPVDAIRSEAEVEKIRKQRQDQQRRAAQLAEVQAQGEAAQATGAGAAALAAVPAAAAGGGAG